MMSITCTRNKRPRRGVDGGKIHQNNINIDINNNNRMKCVNRTLFLSLLALATLAVNMDTIAVVAFTPGPTFSSTTSTITTPSSSTMNTGTVVAPTLSSTKRRRRAERQQVSSTIVDDDSTATATAASILDGHKLSIVTSSILNQQRIGRLGSTTKNVVVLDDDEYKEYNVVNSNNNRNNNNNNNNNNKSPVHFVVENDIVTFPSNGSTSTSTGISRIVSTTNKRNRNSKMIRPKSRNSSPDRKKAQKKNISISNSNDNGVTSRSSSALLTHDEEREITYSIRDLHKAVKIRDELEDDEFPTEEDWAKACGLEVMSLRRIMSKGQEARTVLVSANVGLVTSIAKRHYHALKQATDAMGGVGTILTLQDMIQEGNFGLMKAAERFEPERGWRFSTYATYWIRQRILRSISDSSRVIRLPAHVTATLQKLNRARKEMAAEIGRVPSDPELAHYMKISVDKLRKISEKARSVVSLESPLRMGTNHKAEMDQRTIGDFIASDAPTPEDHFQQQSLQRDIRAVINELAEREREVLILRFGLDNGESMSTSQTAMRLGITIDRVRYVEARALNKLRSPQRNYRLKDYLGGGHHNIAEEKQEQLQTSSPMTAKSNSKRRRYQDQNQNQPSAQEKFWFF